jgi:putative DNA methylase
MIPKECKRLAEVDFPIAVVSKHAAREKSIRHGHPSTLHLWWARRPLAACRAMLLGLLLPDPCDENCPGDFKITARELLPKVQGQIGPKNEDLRKSLLKFIGDFANWDRAADGTYLEVSRGLVKSAHLEETPLIVDPFAGGGSIPLEAVRLGCDTFASDLNPVACLILKVLLEEIPAHGPDLAEKLRQVGLQIKMAAEKELAEFYPTDTDGAKPIAYLWARSVRCESPKCGAEIPIFKSPWLASRGVPRPRYFKTDADGGCVVLVIESAPLGGPIKLGLQRGLGREDAEPGFVRLMGTKALGNNANVVCPCCGAVVPGNTKNPRTSSQLAAQRGGADVLFDDHGNRIGGAYLLAVVTVKQGEPGRTYRLPTVDDYKAVSKSITRLKKLSSKLLSEGLSSISDEPLPPIGTLGFRVQRYGMTKWGDLFTSRQKLLLLTIANLVAANTGVLKHLLSLCVDKLADKATSLCRWKSSAEYMAGNTFSRQALPIVWDFCEAQPFSGASGGWEEEIEWISKVVNSWGRVASKSGQSIQADACESPLPDDTSSVWFTDPPYYDAVPYADLSDFFFVWLKRTSPDYLRATDRFVEADGLTPKRQEIVQDEIKIVDDVPKDSLFFEKMMAKVFAQGRRTLKDDGIGCVVFAHKTTEGWEALLSGLIRGGWTITGSWPLATEMSSRLRARDSAALATSVHLVCRPRPDNALVADWEEVFRVLPVRVREWMERLQAEHIRGADLVFACIGPALEIYSRYSKVVDAEDREIPLGGDPEATEPHKRGYLAYVWEAVGRAALEQVLGTAEAGARNGAAGALEEDARLTALFLWTLQSTNGEDKEKGKSKKEKEEESESEEDEDDEEETSTKARKKKGLTLVFDVVRRFAQPLGIHLDNWEDRIIETDKGIVRLLPVGERGAQLFGQDGADLVAEQLERGPASTFQLTLFPDKTDAAPTIKGKKGRGRKAKGQSDSELKARQEATTLDRVHAAMLLQAGGRTNALRALLQAERDRSPDFLRLANALSALYPKQSEEKRLLDAMLLAVPK